MSWKSDYKILTLKRSTSILCMQLESRTELMKMDKSYDSAPQIQIRPRRTDFLLIAHNNSSVTYDSSNLHANWQSRDGSWIVYLEHTLQV